MASAVARERRSWCWDRGGVGTGRVDSSSRADSAFDRELSSLVGAFSSADRVRSGETGLSADPANRALMARKLANLEPPTPAWARVRDLTRLVIEGDAELEATPASLPDGSGAKAALAFEWARVRRSGILPLEWMNPTAVREWEYDVDLILLCVDFRRALPATVLDDARDGVATNVMMHTAREVRDRVAMSRPPSGAWRETRDSIVAVYDLELDAAQHGLTLETVSTHEAALARLQTAWASARSRLHPTLASKPEP